MSETNNINDVISDAMARIQSVAPAGVMIKLVHVTELRSTLDARRARPATAHLHVNRGRQPRQCNRHHTAAKWCEVKKSAATMARPITA